MINIPVICSEIRDTYYDLLKIAVHRTAVMTISGNQRRTLLLPVQRIGIYFCFINVSTDISPRWQCSGLEEASNNLRSYWFFDSVLLCFRFYSLVFWSLAGTASV